MKQGFRKKLFLFLVFAFILLAPTVIFWSQGYRLDWEKRSFSRVGALVIRASPANAKISVGNRTVEARASILYTGTLVKNILPRTYEITVSRGADYFPWKKTLPIEPLSVTKATHILLIPKQPTITPLATNVPSLSAIWLNRRNSALLASSGTRIYEITPKDGSETKTKVSNTLRTETPRSVELSSNGENMVLLYRNGAALYRPTKTPSVDPLENYLQRLFAPQDAPKVTTLKWDPSDQKILFLVTDKGLYRVDVIKNEYARVDRATVRGIGGSKQTFYIASSTIWRIEGEKPLPELALNTLLKPADDLFEIAELPDDSFLVYENGGGAFVITQESEQKRIGNRTRFHTVSPDKKKLVFIDGKNLILKPLDRNFDDFVLEDMEPRILKTLPAQPRQIFWLKTSWQVILIYDTNVEIVEVDPRPPVNASTLSLGPITSFAFDQRTNTFYWLDNEGALRSWNIFE